MEKMNSESPINIVFTGPAGIGKTYAIRTILKEYGCNGNGLFHPLVVETDKKTYRVNIFDEIFRPEFGEKNIKAEVYVCNDKRHLRVRFDNCHRDIYHLYAGGWVAYLKTSSKSMSVIRT
jgi:hypothetical protein